MTHTKGKWGQPVNFADVVSRRIAEERLAKLEALNAQLLAACEMARGLVVSETLASRTLDAAIQAAKEMRDGDTD